MGLGWPLRLPPLPLVQVLVGVVWWGGGELCVELGRRAKGGGAPDGEALFYKS